MARADKKISLKTFRVDSNGVDLAKGMPERLKILNWGENLLNTGEKVIVDETTLGVFEGNQKAMGRETIPIDYEHSSVPGTPAYERSKPSDAMAGYANPVVIRGDGIYLEKVSTTPDGLKNAPNFKDLSPAPLVENGRVVAMHSCALTVAGAVEGLTLNDAAVRALSAQCRLETLSVEPNAYKNGQTDYSGLKDMNMDYFRKSLGMNEASDEDVFKKVVAIWNGLCGADGTITNKSNSMTPTWPDTWNAKITDAISAAVTPLTAQVTKLQTELSEKNKKSDADEKNRVIADAIKEGKAITLSADQIGGFSLDQIRIFTAALPKNQVPMTALVVPLSADQKPKRNMETAISAHAAQVTNARQMIRN